MDYCTSLFLGFLGGYHPPLPGNEAHFFAFAPLLGDAFTNPRLLILLALIPALGGLICGIIKYKLLPVDKPELHETDVFIDAFHNERGVIKVRNGLVRGLCSVLTIGAGGSVGREGPSAMLGATIGSFFSRVLKLEERERRKIVAAAAGAGIAAIFKSPLGGAFFGIETLYRRDMEIDALVPAIICSIAAYSISCSFFGFGHLFEIGAYDIEALLKPFSLLLFLCLGVASGIFGGGYGFIQMAFYGELTLSVLTFITVAKIIGTALTLGSGGSGGSFIPALVMGTALGGATGHILSLLFPRTVANPWLFALIGAAAFFGAAANAPLTALFIVCEISGSYTLFVPALLAIIPAYSLVGRRTIYPEQYDIRRESPAHRREFMVDILEGIKVADAYTKDVLTIPGDKTVKEGLHFAEKTGHITFPVMDKTGKLVGITTIMMLEEERAQGAVYKRIDQMCTKEVIVAYPDEFLEDVLQKMNKYNIGRLPVVRGQGEEEGEELVGIISRLDIIREHCRRQSLLREEGYS